MNAHVDTASTEHVNAGHLLAFITRIEKMHEERKAISDDIAEIYSEAKGTGFDVKVMKEIVKIRSQDRAKRREFEEILDLYMNAIGADR